MWIFFGVAGGVGGGGGELGGRCHFDGPIGDAVLLAMDSRGLAIDGYGFDGAVVVGGAVDFQATVGFVDAGDDCGGREVVDGMQ